jgi:hypothetical protein
MEDYLKNAMKCCDKLRSDKTCIFKDNPRKQHCTIYPNMCCAMCADETNCDSENGICTWLF